MKCTKQLKMKTIFSAFTTKKQTILINKVLVYGMFFTCDPSTEHADVVSVNLKANTNLTARYGPIV